MGLFGDPEGYVGNHRESAGKANENDMDTGKISGYIGMITNAVVLVSLYDYRIGYLEETSR